MRQDQDLSRQVLGGESLPRGSATHMRLPQGATLDRALGESTVPHVVLPHPEDTWGLIKGGLPFGAMPDDVRRWRLSNLPNLIRGARRVAMARALRLPHFSGSLHVVKIQGDGRVVNYGLASLRVVTNGGVAFIVDAFQNLVELELMKFHGYGTGAGAEAATDSALATELTTQYVGDVRPTGSQTENAANIYETVGTLSPDSGGTIAVTEHGVFSASTAGTLLDRSLFSAINVVASADSLQTTYRLTLTAGG